jgi:hypothetical protein
MYEENTLLLQRVFTKKRQDNEKNDSYGADAGWRFDFYFCTDVFKRVETR